MPEPVLLFIICSHIYRTEPINRRFFTKTILKNVATANDKSIHCIHVFFILNKLLREFRHKIFVLFITDLTIKCIK